MALSLPPVPASLKSIQHYLKTAAEHESRDPVVTYWCRLYALQTALKIDKKTDGAKTLLVKLMDWLEVQKKTLSDNEAITNDIAAQAHIENYALNLFQWADGQDRAGVFNKNVVKAFYSAGMLMDVLTTFGELEEEIAANCKYAKWKAAYIHNCLKNGETPVPGPATTEDTEGTSDEAGGGSGLIGGVDLPSSQPQPPSHPNDDFVAYRPPPATITTPVEPIGGFSAFASTMTPEPPSANAIPYNGGPPAGAPVKLDAVQISKAQKYCKFAGSALNYDDVPEAINYFHKALRLLQTGEDS
uniref:Vacuolar protein sorting-associated protein VTA1 n=1 Tax=Lygus hesperus TaxID=30085 RepID=A0A0K8SSV8_LYGHE